MYLKNQATVALQTQENKTKLKVLWVDSFQYTLHFNTNINYCSGTPEETEVFL